MIGLKIWNHRSPTIPTPPKLANYVFVSVCTPCMPSFVLEEVDLFWIHNLSHCVNYYSWCVLDSLMMELFLKIHNTSQILWIYGRKYRLHLNQLIIQERGVEENDSLQFLDEISQYTSRLRSLYSHWYSSRMDTLLLRSVCFHHRKVDFFVRCVCAPFSVPLHERSKIV
jgi:hypothetical protein